MVILSFIFGVVITFFALGLVVHCKDNEPKNNVRFFVKRVSIYQYSLCIKGKYKLHTIITKKFPRKPTAFRRGMNWENYFLIIFLIIF